MNRINGKTTGFFHQKPTRCLVAVSLAALLVAGGCKRSATDKPAPAKLDAAVAASVSDEEARQWADQMADILQRSDVDALGQMIDLVDMFEKGAQGVALPANHREAFLQGVRDVAKSASRQWAHMGREGTINVLRVYRDGGQVMALLRNILHDHTVNYMEFPLAKMPDGAVVATDCLSFIAGQTLGELAKSMAVQVQASIADNKATPEVQAILALQKPLEKMRQGDLAGALQLLDALPDSQKNSQHGLHLRLIVTGQIPEAHTDGRYMKMLETFREYLPDNPSADLYGMEYFFLKGDYSAVEQCVDNLDKLVGGDPYLTVIRSRCARLSGNPDRAYALALQATQAEPDLIHGHYALLNAANDQNDFPTVAATLTTLVNTFDVDVEEILNNHDELSAFLNSPEGARWLIDRGLTPDNDGDDE